MSDAPAAWHAQVVAVEQEGEHRAFVSLDDLERIASEDPARLSEILGQLRTVFESWHNRAGGVYVRRPP